MVFEVWALVVFVALPTVRTAVSWRASVRNTVDVPGEGATVVTDFVLFGGSVRKMNIHVSAGPDGRRTVAMDAVSFRRLVLTVIPQLIFKFLNESDNL